MPLFHHHHHHRRRTPTPPPTRLQLLFPHTQTPIIISAPMLGVSNGHLAASVSLAGGLGIIPGGYDFSPSSSHLTSLSTELLRARSLFGLSDRPLTPLPVAVGFILCHPSAKDFSSTAIPLLQEHSPQGVWLFAPDTEKYPDVQREVVEAVKHSGFTVFAQVGTVNAARKAVRDGADVVVAQGADAGGHQYAGAAGTMGLVPEVRTMLDEEFPGKDVVLAAAGGVVDGRGVAAALALGAEAVVMGTRFILSEESSAAEFRKQVIQQAVDGGVATAKLSVLFSLPSYLLHADRSKRSTFHDDIQGTTLWPSPYDGRAIISQSYLDHASGLTLAENLKKFKEAKDAGDNSRMVIWAGTGVGLVRQNLPAGEIVQEVREQAVRRIRELQSLIPGAKSAEATGAAADAL